MNTDNAAVDTIGLSLQTMDYYEFVPKLKHHDMFVLLARSMRGMAYPPKKCCACS